MNGFKHILVDGWNAIHSHPQLKGLLSKGSHDAARSMLSDILSVVHDFNGVRLTIIYDGSGDEVSIVRKNSILTFSEVYTPSSMTADELIERLCATSKNPAQILVVSRDNLLRLTVSSFGAMSIEPETFFDTARGSRSGIGNAIASGNAKNAREWKSSNVFSKLDTLVVDINSAMKSEGIFSKRVKKKMKRAASAKKSDEKSISGQASEKNIEKSGLKKEQGGKAVKSPANPQPPHKRLLGGRPPSNESLQELKNIFSRNPVSEKTHPVVRSKKKRNRG